MARSVVVSRWLVASSKMSSAGLRKQRPGDRQPLPLAAGEIGPAFAEHRFVALGQAGDELLQAGGAGRGDDVVQLRLGRAQGDVLPQRAVEDERLLRHDADAAAEAGQVEVAQVDAVDEHLALASGRRTASAA